MPIPSTLLPSSARALRSVSSKLPSSSCISVRCKSTTSPSSASSSSRATNQQSSAPARTYTASATSNIIDAKPRIREHARFISASHAKSAIPAADRPTPSPGFQQVPTPNTPGIELPTSPPDIAEHGDLDPSFIGLTGGQIFHEMMLRHNVSHIFGYPGGAILPVFDAIHASPNFQFILPRHEQGAGHMAEGYARVSGKPGVVLVTSGPGATNVITPMQDALSDGIPLVVFTGQVAQSAIGSDAFQEADVIGISRGCTKWNVMVKDVAELPRRINEAFKIATSGRPGPVLVDLPKDVTAAVLRQALPFRATTPFTGTQSTLPMNPLEKKRKAEDRVDRVLIAQAAALINQAKRPVIYAGAGVLTPNPESGKTDLPGPELLALLSKVGNIPVTTTLQGLGAFDEYNPLSLHMLGMHGSAYANLAMQQADVIIALGARFDDRVTGTLDKFAPAAREAQKHGKGGIIHFEVLPKNVNKVVEAVLPILGDVVENLQALVPLIEHSPREEWHSSIQEWKRKYPFTYAKSDGAKGERLKPQEIIEELERQTMHRKDDVILTTGVGQHQMWAAQFYRWTKGRSMVTSGGLGTMGFGLPAAIGAALAAPNKIVVDVDGDASFSMTAMELATAAQFNIPIKVLILNNTFQGMVLQWQDLFYDSRYSHTKMTNPDFVKLAEACGVKALRLDGRAGKHSAGLSDSESDSDSDSDSEETSASSESELEKKMREFLAYDKGPIVMECIVERGEHVFPMVAAGKALHEGILHPLLRGKE